MAQLPDPRRYGRFDSDDPVGVLIDRHARGEGSARRALLGWLRDCLARERDEDLFEVMRRIPGEAAYRRFWDLVCLVSEGDDRERDSTAVAVHLFAIPIVLITGARARNVVPGVLGDIEAVRALLERHGAVGATRNFGLSNALCSAEALERLKPSRVYRWSRAWSQQAERELPPAEVRVQPGREQVHVRFLPGVGVVSGGAPSFLETASNIGAWGIALTRELVRQLAQPALELIAIPRPPAPLLRAAHTGRCAELEVAFNVFVSNSVRQFRASVGDPAVVIAAHRLEHGGAELRVSMSCLMDDALLEGFRWPLHPLDDFSAIRDSIMAMLGECRLRDVCVVEEVQPDRLGSGGLFLRAADRVTTAAARH
ncbi:MAG: hypothetical protein ACT4PS_16835 [Betaproteobacteria bacterium]